jgi:hypothetical protein
MLETLSNSVLFNVCNSNNAENINSIWIKVNTDVCGGQRECSANDMCEYN